MITNRSEPSSLIAAERRRKIYERAMQQGSVSVSALVDILGVGPKTIRNDLDLLESEGKLVRSHGGAILKDSASPRPPYTQTRGSCIKEKTWIGEAALSYMPASGTVFIGPGSTTYQLVTRLSAGRQLHVFTNGIEVAAHLVSHGIATVEFPGGVIRSDSLSSDMTLPEDTLEHFYWDVTFMGVEAIDIGRGITSVDRVVANWEKRIIDRGTKTIVLCDSSKIGRYSYACVGDVSKIDVLITDSGVSERVVEGFVEQGVEVVVAGPHGVQQVLATEADDSAQ